MNWPYCDPSEVSDYTCYRTREPLRIDGRLDERAWQLAPQSPRFVDVITGARGLFDTRAAALWDDTYLYVGFWIEEPNVEAHLTERDALVCVENDVEVFIDGGDAYYELEINALGTLYEVLFIWQDAYTRGSKFDVPEFDLLSRQVRVFGGNYDRSAPTFWHGIHPRGVRWAFLDWDLPGLQSAVYVDGALNDPAVVDRGWMVELAFPWAGMKWLADGRALPPQAGDVWRLFFGRYEKMNLSGVTVNPGWAWNRVGIGDNHAPECFTRLHFSTQCVEDL